MLAPDNTDALFMLTKGWVGYGFGFIEDEMEAAEDAGDDDLADYQRKRARMAYDRAVFYGLQLLAQRADGFETAKKNELTLAKWLSDNFTSDDDAESLFWTGYGWLARVNLMKGDDTEGPAFVADLYVGVAMLERAVALDPTTEHYSGMLALAAYHARTGMAEMDQAKQMFDTALAKTEGKNLMVQLNYATKYACMKGDGALYQDMINKVLQAPDPDPHQRLTNAIAKRRAKRWLGKRRVKDACGIDLSADQVIRKSSCSRKLLTALATAAVALGLAASADAATTLKIGTLAPGDSAWGKEFKKWAKEVSDDTNGELQLDFQWNGQAGDEVLMVQKMRSGQLDGAAVTAIGLAQTGVTDVLLFQMPGLFANWGKLDAARNAMKADFDQQFQAKGFTILGWGDVGAAKTMSIGFEVHHPTDLQGKGCFFLAGRSHRAEALSRPSAASRRRRSPSRRSCPT